MDIRRYKQIIAIALGIHIVVLFAIFSEPPFKFVLPIPLQAVAVLLAFPAGIVCGWIAKDLDLKSAEIAGCIITYIIAIVLLTLIVFFVVEILKAFTQMWGTDVKFDVRLLIKAIIDAAWSIARPEFISEMLAFIIPFYGHWFYLRMEEARKGIE